MTQELEEGRVPAEIAANPYGLLIKPDKNSIEWKALAEAADNAHMSALRLMLNLGITRVPGTGL